MKIRVLRLNFWLARALFFMFSPMMSWKSFNMFDCCSINFLYHPPRFCCNSFQEFLHAEENMHVNTAKTVRSTRALYASKKKKQFIAFFFESMSFNHREFCQSSTEVNSRQHFEVSSKAETTATLQGYPSLPCVFKCSKTI